MQYWISCCLSRAAEGQPAACGGAAVPRGQACTSDCESSSCVKRHSTVIGDVQDHEERQASEYRQKTSQWLAIEEPATTPVEEHSQALQALHETGMFLDSLLLEARARERAVWTLSTLTTSEDNGSLHLSTLELNPGPGGGVTCPAPRSVDGSRGAGLGCCERGSDRWIAGSTGDSTSTTAAAAAVLKGGKPNAADGAVMMARAAQERLPALAPRAVAVRLANSSSLRVAVTSRALSGLSVMTKPEDPPPHPTAAADKGAEDVVAAQSSGGLLGAPLSSACGARICPDQQDTCWPRYEASTGAMPLPPQPASVLPVISGANADGPALPPTCAARSTRAAPTWLASTQALLSDVHDMVWQPVSAAGAAQAVGLWTGTWCGRPVALKLSTLESISAAVLRAHLANTSAVAAGSKVSDGGSAAACTAATAAATEAAVAMLRPLIKSAAVVHRNLMRVYDIRLAPLGEAPAGPVASSGSYTPRHLWWAAATSRHTTPHHQSFMDSASLAPSASAVAAAIATIAADGRDGRRSASSSPQQQGGGPVRGRAPGSIRLASLPAATAVQQEHTSEPQSPCAQQYEAANKRTGSQAAHGTATPLSHYEESSDITIARSHLPAAPPHIITPPVHEGGLPLLQRGQAGEPRAAVAAVAATAAAGACCAPAPAADTASGLYQLAEQQTELLPTAAATLPESFKVGGTCGPGAAGTQPGEVAAGYNMNTTEVLASPGEGGIAMSSLLFSSFGKTLGPQETVVDWREAPLAAVAAATTAAAQTRSSTEVGAAAGAEARAVEARAFGKAVSMAAPQTPPANGASPAGASPAVNDGPQQQGPTAHQAVGHSMRIVEAGSPTLMDGARVAVGAAPGVTALNSVRLLPHTPPPSPPPPPLRPPGHRPSEAAEPRGCALVVVMEYCDQGDLRTMACSPSSPFRASRAWTLHAARRALLRTAREVASALATLHAAGIVHGALWPSNVLLARSSADRRGFSVRVADAGSESLAAATAANPLASTARAACMALLAPELLALGAPVSSAAADVYAFGMLLYLMAAAEMPFAGCHLGPVLMGVARGELRPEWPMQQHAHLAPLFAACIAHKPEQRPTFEQVHVEITSLEKQVKAERRAVLAAATAAAP